MKPLLQTVVAISLLLAVQAHPENIEDVKELPQTKEPIVEAEESEPQKRLERCSTCGPLNIKSPKEVLASLQALPGAEVHTQQSFEGCSSEKGCAGVKVKDGQVVQRYGNANAFKAAEAADTGNEFNFLTAGTLAANPFWWMNQDGPFKNGNFEKFSKSSFTSSSSGSSSGLSGALNLAANPFLNGDFSNVATKPNFQSSSSSFESSYSSKGDLDLAKNPFLNGGFKAGAFGAQNAGAFGAQNAGAFGAQNAGAFGAQNAGAFGAQNAGAFGAQNAGAFGAQNAGAYGAQNAGFGAGLGQTNVAAGAGNYAAGSNSFGAQSSFGAQGNYGASSLGTNYAGAGVRPIGAGGSNVNLVQTAQKASDFDFSQQTQQNIDELFQGSGNVDTSGGDLQQTCAGQGYICVPRAQCNNGVVNSNGANVLQANTKKQYCSISTEICCRLEVATVNTFGQTNLFQSNKGLGTNVPIVPTPNIIETDSFSAGSENNGIYRPGVVGLKPGIPYLPPIDNTNQPSNIIPSTFPPPIITPRPLPPRPITVRPITPIIPITSTAAPGYLPPIGEQTINRETIVPPNPNYIEGSLILDQNRPGPTRQPVPVIPSDIPAGCAAALKCTPIEFCTAEGVISNTSVILSRDQDAYRVPLTDCRDIETGRLGKCCRDPFYTDPWPTNQLGKWVPGVFGGNDGKYVPDSRGSSNNVRPVTPPTTGSVIFGNFRTTPKPTVPTGFATSPVSRFPTTTIPFIPKPTPGVGQFTKGGQGQFTKGGQGQFTKGGQGQYSKGGQGQYGLGSRGQVGVVGQSQFSQVGKSQVGLGSQFGRGQVALVGQGDATQLGVGQYGQGQYGQVGRGQIGVTGQAVNTQLGVGQNGVVGQGQYGQVGRGQIGVANQGQFSQGGRGQIGVVGQGQYGQIGRGQTGIVGQGVNTQLGVGQFSQVGRGQVGVGQAVGVGQGQLGVGQVAGLGQFSQTGRGQVGVLGQGQSTLGVGQVGGGQIGTGQTNLIGLGEGQVGVSQVGQQGQVGVGQVGLAGQGQYSQVGRGQSGLVGQGVIGAGVVGQGTQLGVGQIGVVDQGEYTQLGTGQIGVGGQGQYSQVGRGQIGVGNAGQIGAGSQVTNAFSRGQGQIGVQGIGAQGVSSQGAIGNQGFGIQGNGGQGQLAVQGIGAQGIGGQGQLAVQGIGAQGIAGQGQFGSQGIGAQGVIGQGQYGSQGQGLLISQGQGEVVSQGQGQLVSQGEGQLISQGQGQFGVGGQGQFGVGGIGQYETQGQGQQGFGVINQASGLSKASGQLVTQGQGNKVTQGQGQKVSQGQGQKVNQGQGQKVTQGIGQYVTNGQGTIVSQGGGAYIEQGQGQTISQGFGSGIRQGQGFAVENEYGESVQRVFLQRYNGDGKCGLLNPQRPYGNKADLEVDFAEIPWQAMVLLQTNRSLLCGGVITRPDVVVTSAACVEGLQAKNVLIKGGEWKLGIDDEPLPFQIVQVKHILRHPLYKPGSLLYDSAVLVLTENLRLSKNINPICLPSSKESVAPFYNGVGECIVTGWGKIVLQAHLEGAIMHSLNVSLINPGECKAKLSSDYPHLLEQYNEDSCVCGQPTNPLNNICKVDIGSALACTSGDGRYVMQGVYSWDSGCQVGNQIASFYKFDLEWYEWSIGLIESVRFAQFTTITTGKITGFKSGVQTQFGGVNSQFGSQFGSGLKTQFGGASEGSSGIGFSGVKGFAVSGKGQYGFEGAGQAANQAQFSTINQFGKFGAQNFESGFNTQINPPINKAFSASYSEKKVFQTEPKIITYTTKPEIVTYTTKPEIFTFTTKPKIVTYTTKPKFITYTTKPKIITYTTKPQIITYETSGSGTNPQYVAPGVTFNPNFSDLIGHNHDSQCKCAKK
ncbi:uncharacterized protein LOC125055288 isoform X1 [Pieris napi]|uniref:uncharacterized protein LOC125055288 isoform X1 n=1 Tax=Pieris napi TaxID=78633 RepID=UPI001FBBCC96|nr:uncharacterized protein LOC125055288 isoform X1 [Pieris napi]